MAIYLSRFVLSLAQKKDLSITSFRERRLRDIERQYERDKDVSSAMDAIKKEFGYEFSKDDYRFIEKELR